MPEAPTASVRRAGTSLCAALVFLAAPGATSAQTPPMSAEARAVFEQAKSRLLQLRLLHKATRAQSSTGSGFFASADGLVLTNYHVVSKAALDPAAYEVELQRSDGATGRLRLVAVDVANDLAVLSSGTRDEPFLAIRTAPLAKGDRGYSTGHPLNLGLTIVEGTYNGYVEKTALPRIHYTGAINPGMSGGPAIAADGKVFGVNVAVHTGGQLVSFLVPPEPAAALLRQAGAGSAPPADFRKEVGAQLVAQQARLFERLLAEPVQTSRMGRYRVPDAPAAFMQCGGRAQDDKEKLFEQDAKNCWLDDSIYVDDGFHTGELRFVHRVFESRGLGAVRFASLLEDRYGSPAGARTGANKKELTRFRCHDDFVRRGEGTLRVALCSRAYQGFAGLYDFHLRVLTVDSESSALLSTLTITGASFDNGMRFAQRHLEAIAWTK